MQNRIKPAQLADWLRFCSDSLTANCPRNVRIVSYLAIEHDEPKKIDNFLDKLLDEPWLDKPELELRQVELEDVKKQDLLGYLRHHSSCPASLQNDIARFVMSETKGQFQSILDLLAVAGRSGWSTLWQRLRKQDPDIDPDDF